MAAVLSSTEQRSQIVDQKTTIDDSRVNTIDVGKLKQKYIEERHKRLQNGGINQYRLIDDATQTAQQYLTDPYVAPGFTRDPIDQESDVVIIGGGYGGLLCAVRLLERGIDNIRIIEKGGDFGGTWYWNRYPGAQCDIESYIYMPLLEETGYIPTEKYSHADELRGHAERIGRQFNLYPKTLFQTEVSRLDWNDTACRWVIKTNREDSIRARFVIPAAGPLHRPKLPGVQGLDDFRGRSFHSSRWDYEYTGGDDTGSLGNLSDKRVGIIGTGATAVQIVPHLGRWAKKLYVFQRTPSSVDVRNNRPTDPQWAQSLKQGWQRTRMDNFDHVVNGLYKEEDMVSDGWTDIIRKLLTRPGTASSSADAAAAAAKMQMADYQKMESIRARVDSRVHDKSTAEALKPWYNQFCKRPCFHDEYLQTFNLPTVELVDTKGRGIDRVTERGVVANGVEYEVDCLVYATGFELATEWSHRSGFEIYGQNGLTTSSKWHDGYITLHGWGSHGFPNCFFVSAIQAALSPNFLHVTGEQAEHFAYIIDRALKESIVALQPTADAELRWVDTCVELAKARLAFLKECTPGYYNNEGDVDNLKARRNVTYGAGSPAFFKVLRDWREADKFEGLEARYSS
ncbi:hypothetical protein BJX96DRAFT_184927 [Aspergillus floccosus]